jgi:Sec-independent protein translocase protein TatA
MDPNKRRFFTKTLFREIGKTVQGFRDGLQEAEAEQSLDEFFDSYESSYSLTLAYPDEILLASAEKHHIETEGRDKKEIVKELFEKYGGL